MRPQSKLIQVSSGNAIVADKPSRGGERHTNKHEGKEEDPHAHVTRQTPLLHHATTTSVKFASAPQSLEQTQQFQLKQTNNYSAMMSVETLTTPSASNTCCVFKRNKKVSLWGRQARQQQHTHKVAWWATLHHGHTQYSHNAPPSSTQ